MRSLSITAALVCFALLNPAIAEEKLSMSEADKAMYAELLDNNPAEMEVLEGEELFNSLIGSAAYAKMLGVKEKDLAKTIAGFPRYIEPAKKVVTLSQTLQMALADQGKEVLKLGDTKVVKMTAYIKSLAKPILVILYN